jgi:hypothetical protein
MPQYTFALTDGQDTLQNPKVVELAGDAAAREEALLVARELRQRDTTPERDWDGWFLSIRDEQGREVDTIPIADVPELS